MQSTKEISFGKFRLDLVNECLWQGTRAISLRPKAFAVLKLLVENPGLLVTKQQVLDAVWPGTFVGDAVLKDNIRQLREALNDDAAAPAYIETSHRRGYRFIAKFTESATTVKATAKKTQNPKLSTDPPVSAPSPALAVLGRDAELAKMSDLLNRAAAGERQIVFVAGEPGIGKTTLVQAFLQQRVQSTFVRVARGQCLEHYGAGEAYLPVLDGFSRLCRSEEGAEILDVLRHQAPSWLAQMPTLLPPSERNTVQARSAEATRERMLREMGDAIETLTVSSPLLLVLEDLHWSDYSTLELISYLARRQDPARLMIIGTYRPVDVILSDHPLKGVKRDLQAHGLCIELSLEFLSLDAVREYLKLKFPGHHFPLRLQRAIYRRTEGNPLFMVNLLQFLTDQRLIVQKNESWELRVDVSEIEKEVPANIRQLIEEQIERLSADERRVLEAATVAGMECSSVAIAAGLAMPMEWVEQHCEELARRHQFLSPAWLVELPDGTITPRHRFIHVLYREVPYRLIPAMRRSQIHRRIGERGVAIYGERASDIAPELAMHFEQSHDWPRALEYLLLAAENAMARSVHHEAAKLAGRGVEILNSIPESPERDKQEMRLRMMLTVSLMSIKGFASAEVEEINARGRELFWQYGPSPELFYMLWTLNLYRQFSGDMRSSLEISYQLLELGDTLKDAALIMQAHRALAAVLVLLGRHSEALEHIETGSALYVSNLNQRYSVLVVLDSGVMFECFAALALLAIGRCDQAVERLSAGLELAQKLGHPQTSVVAKHVAAQIHQIRGDADLAYELAKEAAELADEYGLELWRAYGIIEAGWAEAELGNVQDGIEQMQRGLALHESMGSKLRTPYFLCLLADQLGKAGHREEGLRTITNALTLAQSTGEGYALPELHRIKGELLIKSGRFVHNLTESTVLSQARTCFADALAIAKQQGAKLWELRAALSMDRLNLILGNPDHTQLAEIYSTFTEGFETADLKQARAQLSLPRPA